MYVVVSALPFHITTEFDWKLVPLAMSQNVGLPADTAFGVRKVRSGAGLSVAPVVLGLVAVQAQRKSRNEVNKR